MKHLVKILDKNGKRAVSAKDLHAWLSESLDRNYSRWTKRNIISNGFAEENRDYVTLPMEEGDNSQDFALTIDFAKELAMMSRTDRGKQVRTYFIDVEKEHKRKLVAYTQRDMTDALKEHRELDGKDTLSFHYSNEARMINQIVGIDDMDTATQEQINMVSKLRKANTTLIDVGMDYQERKDKLTKYAIK